MRIAEGGFPWPSTVALLYPLGAAIHIAAATPAGLADVGGYGLGNLSYLLFAAGICGGSFRILGLNTRGRVFGAAVVSFLMGTLLSNIGKVTGLEVAGLVAVLLIVAAGSYGVLQSYRQDLDRPSRVLSLLLAIPALVVISHIFPVIGIPVLWSIAIATWCLLLYIGRARGGTSTAEEPQRVGRAATEPTERLNVSAPVPEPALAAPGTQPGAVTCEYCGGDHSVNECADQESKSDPHEPTFQDLLEARLPSLDFAPYSPEETQALSQMPEFSLIWPPAERNPDTAATVEEEGVRTMSTPDYSYKTSQDFFSQRAALPKQFRRLAESIELYLTDFSSRCGQYEQDGEGNWKNLVSRQELPRVQAIRDALKKAKELGYSPEQVYQWGVKLGGHKVSEGHQAPPYSEVSPDYEFERSVTFGARLAEQIREAPPYSDVVPEAATPSEKPSTPKYLGFTKRPMREVTGGGPVAFVGVRPSEPPVKPPSELQRLANQPYLKDLIPVMQRIFRDFADRLGHGETSWLATDANLSQMGVTFHWSDAGTNEVLKRELVFHPWGHAHRAMEDLRRWRKDDDASVVRAFQRQMIETIIHELAHHLPEAGPNYGEDHGPAFKAAMRLVVERLGPEPIRAAFRAVDDILKTPGHLDLFLDDVQKLLRKPVATVATGLYGKLSAIEHQWKG